MLGILLGQLGQRLEVLDVALELAEHRQLARGARVLGGHLAPPAPGHPRSRAPHLGSSASARSLSAAGSKIVREQLQLVADRREALGERL